jgi:hypothetical protein
MNAHRFLQGFRIGRRLADRALLQVRGYGMPPFAPMLAKLERGAARGERIAVRVGIASFFLTMAGLLAALAVAVADAVAQ